MRISGKFTLLILTVCLSYLHHRISLSKISTWSPISLNRISSTYHRIGIMPHTANHSISIKSKVFLYIFLENFPNPDLSLVHFEYHPTRIRLPSFIMSILRGYKLLPKPIAKVGLRTKSSSTTAMTEALQVVFPSSAEEERMSPGGESSYNVGIMVYMWVQEKYRGLKCFNYGAKNDEEENNLSKITIGEHLLDLVRTACRDMGENDYMLIVHDDNGSGKLVKYYQDRGFRSFGDYLGEDKAMICPLGRARLTR